MKIHPMKKAMNRCSENLGFLYILLAIMTLQLNDIQEMQEFL